MKRLFTYTAMLLAVALASCNKEVQPSEDVNIPVDMGGNYIHFDTGVSTRGVLLLNNYLNDQFAVYGYNYRSTWEAAKAMAKPNVFENTPQTVTYADGMYTYDPIKTWTGYNYSFYAYYPISDQIAPIDENVEGEPYITYTLPGGSNPSVFIDVMTASYIDTNTNSSKSVQLNFEHRLAAIDVGARCYYDFDPNPDDNDTSDIVQATVEIEQLWLDFENVVNDKAKIYLNKNIAPEYTASTSPAREMRILTATAERDDNIDIDPNSDGDTQMRIITNPTNKEYGTAEGQQDIYLGPPGSTMILIPQTQYLKVKPSMLYYLRLPDGKYIQEDKKSVGDSPFSFIYSSEFEFDRPLLEGRRYYIQFNFTSDAVSVNIVAADEWDEFDRVYYEFM